VAREINLTEKLWLFQKKVNLSVSLSPLKEYKCFLQSKTNIQLKYLIRALQCYRGLLQPLPMPCARAVRIEIDIILQYITYAVQVFKSRWTLTCAPVKLLILNSRNIKFVSLAEHCVLPSNNPRKDTV